jgi:ribosome-associated toxin RatA of RatAB toxin-antitoxin module
MPRIEKSALLPYPPGALYDVVDDVARYPEFLPWCGGAKAIDESETQSLATVNIDYRGLKQSFTTRNRREPGRLISMTLVEGPFHKLEGRWDFVALGEDGAKIALTLDYDIASGLLAALLAPAFGVIADTMMERFVARAHALHGRK